MTDYSYTTVTSTIVAFITYTKGAVQYVTTSYLESHFLDWLSTHEDTSSYKREAYTTVAIKVAPFVVQQTEKKEATVLRLVKDNDS